MNQNDRQAIAEVTQPQILILSGNDKLAAVMAEMISRGTDYPCDSASEIAERPNLEGIRLILCAGPTEGLKPIAERLGSINSNPAILYLSSEAIVKEGKWNHLPIPISRSQLLAAIEQALASDGGEAKDLVLGSGRFIPSKRLIIDNNKGVEIRLTEKESAILQLLLTHGQAILSRERLYNQIWGRAANVTEHTVDSHLYRLRRKIAPLGCELHSIDSGYCLRRVG